MDELKKEVGATPPYGLVGVCDSPAAIYHVCEKLKDEGYKNFEAHTPFPVHGLENAMDLPASRVPWISLAGGAFGVLGMVWLTWYTNTDYPLNLSGKQPFSWQVYVPLFFEMLVLFSALGTFFGMWGMNKLPAFFHPVMQHPMFPRASDDRFLVVVEATDPRYDAEKIRALLEKLGVHDIAEVQS
jgi:Protein of unknown function (DUF3341)